MAHLNIHDGFIDQSLGQSDVAVADTGISHGPRAQHIRVSDVTIIDGRILVISTDNLCVKNVTIIAALASKSPVFAVRQVNNDLRRRTSTSSVYQGASRQPPGCRERREFHDD
jgi:hypothetical protein